jgi:hypothetical protein
MRGLTINPSGAGSVGIPDFVACPSCDEADAPNNLIMFELTSISDGKAMGSVTRSTDPNGVDDNGNVINSVYGVGASVELTLAPGSPGQIIKMTIGDQSFGQFCDSEAESTSQCGA